MPRKRKPLTEEQKEHKRIYEQNWYKNKGKEKRILANKRWEAKRTEEFKKLKAGLKCEKCGESHFACLEFHHVDPTNKVTNIGMRSRSWSLKKLMLEIDKCIVLCANCHRKEHYPA